MRAVERIGNRVEPNRRMTQEEISGRRSTRRRWRGSRRWIPQGPMHVEEEMMREAERLPGPRHSRHAGLPGHLRWGRQGGSVFLLDRKVPVNVPRVRDRFRGTEVPLPLSRSLPSPRGADEGLRLLRGISCRSYRAAAIPGALGLSPSTVSRRFIRVSSRKLAESMERDLSGHDVVALVLDGKAFGKKKG